MADGGQAPLSASSQTFEPGATPAELKSANITYRFVLFFHGCEI